MRFLILALLAAGIPAQRAVVSHAAGAAAFTDLSTHLAEDAGTSLALGAIERIRTGRRERLETGTDLGGAGTSVQVAGTVFYKVQATIVPKVDEVLAGDAWKPGTPVRCELQVATLPSGERQQRFRTEARAVAAEHVPALLVLRKDRRGYELREAVMADPAIDKGDLAASFTQRARDIVTVSQRIQRLRAGCASADDLIAKAAGPEAIRPLRELLAEKPDLHDPARESWLAMHCGPLERALRDRLARLPKPADGGRRDG